jgi:hypothetical protein
MLRYFNNIAKLTGINRNTVNRCLTLIRPRIAVLCEQKSPLKGEIEVDRSYFGARRVRRKRGRGAYGKTPVFGILQKGGRAFTEIVPEQEAKHICYPSKTLEGETSQLVKRLLFFTS